MQIDKWFGEPGAYVLVDGQYGSTGKGLFAGYIAENAIEPPNWITTNAGPNSGHTAYLRGQKIVTQQLPIASAFYHWMANAQVPRTLINAGAIIDMAQLRREVDALFRYGEPTIHPCATIISDAHREADLLTRSAIASTGKGTGPAVAAKLGRLHGHLASDYALDNLPDIEPGVDRTWDNFWNWRKDRVFVETAQGFSLGLHSTFYPNVTSRECTVMQAITDARIPAQMVKQVAMTVRTFPIRVGNTENSSGACYEDQIETTWDELNLPPEFTTVTGRMRRVFTWSRVQFRAALAANRPNVLFVNFMNYLPVDKRADFISDLFTDYMNVIGGRLPDMYYGFGPYSGQVVHGRWWDAPANIGV